MLQAMFSCPQPIGFQRVSERQTSASGIFLIAGVRRAWQAGKNPTCVIQLRHVVFIRRQHAAETIAGGE